MWMSARDSSLVSVNVLCRKGPFPPARKRRRHLDLCVPAHIFLGTPYEGPPRIARLGALGLRREGCIPKFFLYPQIDRQPWRSRLENLSTGTRVHLRASAVAILSVSKVRCLGCGLAAPGHTWLLSILGTGQTLAPYCGRLQGHKIRNKRPKVRET